MDKRYFVVHSCEILGQLEITRFASRHSVGVLKVLYSSDHFLNVWLCTINLKSTLR